MNELAHQDWIDVDPLMTELELQDRERVIERGLQTYIEVGTALKEIRDRKGYRFTHRTFADYVESRWRMSISSAYNNIAAAEVSQNIQPVGQIEYSKAVALSRLSPEQQRKFVETHNIDEMTKRQIEEAVKAQKEAERRAELAERKAKEAEQLALGFKERADSVLAENERLKREKNPEPKIVTKVVEPDDYQLLKEQVKRQSEQLAAHTREEVERANRYAVRDAIHDLARGVGGLLSKVQMRVGEHSNSMVSDRELFGTAKSCAKILRDAADYLDSLVSAKQARKETVIDGDFIDIA